MLFPGVGLPQPGACINLMSPCWSLVAFVGRLTNKLLTVIGPFQPGGAPGESAAKSGQDQVIAFL